jgi:hypothetical protein
LPTFEVLDRFWNQFSRLTASQQQQFGDARRTFVEVLLVWEDAGCIGVPRFPKSLGVKPMVNRRSILEMAWAPDGRCTWEFGTPQQPGKCHIVWRRIGTHAIYDDP